MTKYYTYPIKLHTVQKKKKNTNNKKLEQLFLKKKKTVRILFLPRATKHFCSVTDQFGSFFPNEII